MSKSWIEVGRFKADAEKFVADIPILNEHGADCIRSVEPDLDCDCDIELVRLGVIGKLMDFADMIASKASAPQQEPGR
jgi:hypothetical protein